MNPVNFFFQPWMVVVCLQQGVFCASSSPTKIQLVPKSQHCSLENVCDKRRRYLICCGDEGETQTLEFVFSGRPKLSSSGGFFCDHLGKPTFPALVSIRKSLL